MMYKIKYVKYEDKPHFGKILKMKGEQYAETFDDMLRVKKMYEHIGATVKVYKATGWVNIG